ncbi:two-component system response regulator [Streptomyces sp. NPDC050504]|uniref:two-component system response regulator n=1 Tax=Streptomyces sp. NPDC050504 TaxID=3365618 RepID=UPI0037A1C271
MSAVPEKVLLVDDHADNLYALESALVPLGYPLARATDGDSALKELLRGSVAVAVLDVMMPRVSGLDVLRYVRHIEQTRDIPVVLITAMGRESNVADAALRLGAADLLLKPVDPWALRIKVKYLYETRRAQYELRTQLRSMRQHPGEELTSEPTVRTPHQRTGNSTRLPDGARGPL